MDRNHTAKAISKEIPIAIKAQSESLAEFNITIPIINAMILAMNDPINANPGRLIAIHRRSMSIPISNTMTEIML
jgi:hypothetical protein